MRVTVLYFAGLREAAGRARSDESVPDGSTVEALWKALRARPDWKSAPGERVGFAVNGAWSQPARVLREGDEVGLLPPVSGG